METCLQTLWELLRDPMAQIMNTGNSLEDNGLAQKQMATIRSVELIAMFFLGLEDRIGKRHLEDCKPKHIKEFECALRNFADKSVAGIREGAEKAKEMSAQCNLCAVCRNCASQFYDEVLLQQMTERKLPYELKDYFTKLPQMHYYQTGMNEDKARKYLCNSFLMLKGFSSSTPTIYSATFDSECLGGGLYLNYNGTGIVIDPGLGFVDSMHRNGIYIRDIDIVIITHDHYDHNADAETISSLLHDYNSYNQRRGGIIKDVFELEDIKPHEIKWIVDSSTANKLSKKIGKRRNLRDYLGENRKQVIKNENGIKLSAIETEHIKNGESFGLIFKLTYQEKCFKIGYTSDTPFFPEISTFFQDVDLLIFHVSDLYRKDVKGVKDKSNHLGYNGSIKLLQSVNAKLAIASEFCCTNGDFRMDFIKSIVDEVKKSKDISLLPGEIGLKIYMPKQEVECSLCKKKVEIKAIKVIAPNKAFGKIQYACRQCAHDVL